MLKELKLVAVFLLTFNSLAYSQDYKKNIEAQFRRYNELIINKDFKTSMDFVPEQFFTIIPREQMILLMEKTFNNPDIEFKLSSPTDINISDSIKIGDSIYSQLTYSSPISMKFGNSKQDDKEATEKRLQHSLIKLSLEETFGVENVKYVESTSFFDIKAQKKAIAISGSDASSWKFLVIEDKQKAILNRLLPKEILDTVIQEK